jgi:Protein of unknown function (DUF2971)
MTADSEVQALKPERWELQRPRPKLFHYTTSTGLQGILETGTVWATNILFLNDAREFVHGLEPLLQRLRIEVAKHYPAAAVSAFTNHLGADSREMQFFVASFCEDGDLLSQWRGYAAPGGYALGLDFDAIEAGFMGPIPVIYQEDRLNRLVNLWAEEAAGSFIRVFSPFLDRVRPRRPADEADRAGELEQVAEMMNTFQQGTWGAMCAMCTSLKNETFSEEREWRLVRARSTSSTSQPLKFRQGPLGLTPFLMVDVRTGSGRLPLREVVVGPGPNSKLRVGAVEMLLEQLGYQGVDVRPSSIPFRG